MAFFALIIYIVWLQLGDMAAAIAANWPGWPF